MTPAPIPFIDLSSQRDLIRTEIDMAIKRVIDSGQYILGPEITALESELAAFCGAKHVLSCANGTDALALPMMALDLGPGDAVFVPAFTFVATAEVVTWFDATPVFVDVEPVSFNMNTTSLEEAIIQAKEDGLSPKGIIPVDLFGHPADYPRIHAIAEFHDLWVIGDAAQSFGGRLNNKSVGSLTSITATSFFPAKPLGCYGDGGAVFCDDADLYKVMESCRVHGQGSHRYEHVRIGMNGRMDAIQAAILREKLKIFQNEIDARQRVARRYNQMLNEVAVVPQVAEHTTSAWAQYTIVVEDRVAVQDMCKAHNVPTGVYYPIPLSKQPAYERYPTAPNGVPVTERLSESVVSLPLHPYLTEFDQERVVAAVREALV